jgi:Pyruvate/2-oxoacid:ferredoxin oxidoreductase delta subunit
MGALTVTQRAVADRPRPRLVAVVNACQGCGACLLTCPEHAIRPRGRDLLVRADRCTGCGECVEVCPVDAIDLVEFVDATGGGQP